MRILYLVHSNLNNKNAVGVHNKISSQIKAMTYLGNNVHFTYGKKNKFYYNNGINNQLIYEFKNKYDTVINKYKNLLKFIETNNIECIYVRYPFIDLFFIKFAKEITQKGIKLYMEIPTFPYDDELRFELRSIDKFCRKFIYKYVSGIIVSSCKIEKIFGVNTIFIDNCVDSTSVEFLDRNFKDNDINIISVSYIRKTNGYDRIIEGLNNYYKKGGQRSIIINFIGSGKESVNLSYLVKRYNLEDRVRFLGSKTGKELDEYFEKANLAIGSLADHRDNIFSKAPLKSREYCARGIPFISAVEDPGFSDNQEFILRFPANDEPIDIEKVIEFYDNLKGKDISKKMRDYAIEHFDWAKQYSKIKDFNNMNRVKEKFI